MTPEQHRSCVEIIRKGELAFKVSLIPCTIYGEFANHRSRPSSKASLLPRSKNQNRWPKNDNFACVNLSSSLSVTCVVVAASISSAFVGHINNLYTSSNDPFISGDGSSDTLKPSTWMPSARVLALQGVLVPPRDEMAQLRLPAA